MATVSSISGGIGTIFSLLTWVFIFAGLAIVGLGLY